MNATISQSAQRLLTYLPGIYRDDPFLGRYLWAFEQVLLGLEQSIEGLATLFDPAATREVGLAWSKRQALLPSAELFRKHVLKRTAETSRIGVRTG